MTEKNRKKADIAAALSANISDTKYVLYYLIVLFLKI